MPIEWTAFPEIQRVEAIASGTVSAAEWVDFLKGLRAANVRGYTKLFDMSHALLDIRASEVRAIAGLINTRAEEGGDPLGAVAFVVDSATALDVSMLYEDHTVAASRPMAINATRELAIEWLDDAASLGSG